MTSGLARRQRGPAINIPNVAAQVEFGKDKRIAKPRQELLVPAGFGAQIDSNVHAILLDRQDVLAGIVQLVDFAFAFNVGTLARRDDLGCEIKPIGIAFSRRFSGFGIDDNNIRRRGRSRSGALAILSFRQA